MRPRKRTNTETGIGAVTPSGVRALRPSGEVTVDEMEAVRLESYRAPKALSNPPKRNSLPPKGRTLPPRGMTAPPDDVTLPARSERVPAKGMTLPPKSEPGPPRSTERRTREALRIDDVGVAAVAITTKMRTSARPRLAKSRQELALAPLDSRDAFVLSLVDGKMTIESLVDVAGMPEDEVLGILARLRRLGIVVVA